MPGTAQAADVLVLGGGPAGAAVAGALAARGLDVLVVHDGSPRAGARCLESASPSLALALAPFGPGALAGLLDDAALGPAAALQALWPGGTPAVGGVADQEACAAADRVAERQAEVSFVPDATGAPEPPRPGGAGPLFRLLDRSRFDAGLQAWARAVGARWLQARGVPAADGSAQLRLADGTALRGRLLIDARGRRAAPCDGPRTVALMATLPALPTGAHRLQADLADHVVEASAGGWLWLASAGGQGVLAAFSEPGALAGLDAAGRRTWLLRALAASPALGRALAHRLCDIGLPSVHDATPRHADAAPAPTRLRVGDAATALSPLASQGLAAALRSAWQAAACAATALATPAMADNAWRFHRNRQQAVAQQHQGLAARYSLAAAAGFGPGFWSARAEAAPPPRRPRPWPALQQPLRPAAGLRRTEAAVLEHDRIVMRPALQHPELAEPLAWLAGVPADRWLDALRPGATLAVLLDRWRDAHGAERTAAAWARLWQDGLVVAQTEPEAASAGAVESSGWPWPAP